MEEITKIPKIIHYCWFGGNEMPEVLKKCMDTWRILEDKGYSIIKWDESNCSFDENDFVRQAYDEKRWGFIGDYYRAKALYDYGGIYLDTDVVVNQEFDDLLNNKCFMGFSCDCAMCTAIIGAEKGAEFIKGLLDMYDNNQFVSEDVILGKSKGRNDYKNGIWTPSNEFWTWYLINRHKEFRLNNSLQEFGDLNIYPKHYFELGSIFKKYYTRHLNYNSWREKQASKSLLRRFKRKLEENKICWIIIRNIRSKQGQKKTSFYRFLKEYDRG